MLYHTTILIHELYPKIDNVSTNGIRITKNQVVLQTLIFKPSNIIKFYLPILLLHFLNLPNIYTYTQLQIFSTFVV